MKIPPKVVWQPQGTCQPLTLSCRCNEILVHGSRGGGKSDCQLAYYRQFVGIGYGPFWRGVIFDREYKNLDDLVAKSLKWFPLFDDGARFLASKSDYRWVWPTGEQLLFRQFKKLSDYWNYHGQEFPFQGWNELTKQSTPEPYTSMASCLRTSFLPDINSPRNRYGKVETPLPDIPLVILSTTNPLGVGHNWVKKHFIDASPPGRIVYSTLNVFNPRTQQKEEVTTSKVHLFSSYRENRYLDPKYIAYLEGIKDPNKRRAWLFGDWNIVAGGAIDDLWDENVHIVPRFKIPRGWRLDRSLDWGSLKPFSVGFWAQSSGEEATFEDGRVFCPPAGSLIRFGEWYGCSPDEANVGIKLSATRVAEGIREREIEFLNDGWIGDEVRPGPADNSIGNEDNTGVDTIEKQMAKSGVTWTTSDKRGGSRVMGLQLIRDRLEAAVRGEGPGLYFMDHCRDSISTLPVLPRSEKNCDDVDTKSEDHIYDELRYRVLAGTDEYATDVNVSMTR
jgi:hypothetical protein